MSPPLSSEVASQPVETKLDADVEVSNLAGDDNSDFLKAENGEESHSTLIDVRDMQRMGKRQQLVRNFRLFSIASFVAIATAAWELGIFLITPGLLNGGRPALLYSVIWGFVIFLPIYLSMAEMASMAPIAGAQYHWVSEFAPERYQKILSYITGWTSTIAWQAGNALGIFLCGTLIQSTISINLPDYAAPSWHGSLLVIGAGLVALAGNVLGSRFLHKWQNAFFVFHVATFFLFLIPIWVKAPRVSHYEVWLDFENYGGWSTMGLAIMAGQLTCISAQVGLDTAAHMSEEVKDAARQVPKAMLMVYVINFILLFPAMVTLVYHMPSVEDALNDDSTYPAIYVLRQCWSVGGITALLVIINFILIASNIVYLAAVTRDMFAFARDKGLPFSDWIAKVDSKRAIPVNAAILSTFVNSALALIYIGSPVAFYAITSLITVALLQCYCLSIGCVLWRRIYHPETLPPAQFSLGKWGVPTNILAVIFSFYSFFWSFWPQSTPVTASDFNWASPLFVITLVVAMVYYVFRGRKNYVGPVVLVEGRKGQ